MQNVKLLLGVILGTMVLVFGVAFLFSSSGETEIQPADQNLLLGNARNIKAQSASASATQAESTDSAVEPTTKVTIVEFSDLQCPACRAAQPLVDQVISAYPESVELVYRHFPLESIHPNAREAAITSEFMADQNLFWEYHDILFDRQEEWSSESDPTPIFLSYAQELGADVEGFEEALKDSEYIDRVDADITDGLAVGVNATPTFFVDGQRINTVDLARVVQSKLE